VTTLVCSSSPQRASVPEGLRTIVLIPAHNEAVNLPSVIRELQGCRPDLPLLVADDGSTDGTPALLDRLAVRFIRLHQRVGVGGAMRAGIRYVSMLGFNVVVRLDGDGQHQPDQIAALLAPILSGEADAVLGSRNIDVTGFREQPTLKRLLQRLLAAGLSAMTGQPLTDATSGFLAFGPAAVEVLGEHHPTGYPEPELLLLLRRNGLLLVEVPASMRPRIAGRSSLTWSRSWLAGARVLLAMVIVPLRDVVRLPR
jgi:glycosyltransferase involved in cell wall biosynthesis